MLATSSPPSQRCEVFKLNVSAVRRPAYDTQGIAVSHMTNSVRSPETLPPVKDALETVGAVCARYEISALGNLLESVRTLAEEDILNVAVLGRFKAGKSSFLNHLFGLPLLPVGVIPVTTVVTEIQYGQRESAQIYFVGGGSERVEVGRIGEFISESDNPGNAKQVSLVRVSLPSLAPYRGIRFVDTPGLESVLEHNTEASLEWLPNVGLALVAVGVDQPLSNHDIDLIRSLSRYTPNVSLLLTKVDVLSADEQAQVTDFVIKQLARHGNGKAPVFLYSVRPGFEALHTRLEEDLLSRVREQAGAQRAAILRHKLDTLIGECEDYLNVALRSAETTDLQRDELRRRILGDRELIDDTRLTLKLVVRHAAGRSRPAFEALVREDERPIRQRMLKGLEREFPSWTQSLRVVIEEFNAWLGAGMTSEISEISQRRRVEFIEPLRHAGRQLSQALQDFRNRLSERALETLGVPLRTTEVDLRVEEPKAPDVRVGKIFDRNWELLSFLVPMFLVKGLVLTHYQRKVGDVVFMNLSRLVAQWEEVVHAALSDMEKESLRRLEGLVATIEKLLTSAGEEAPRIREDLLRLEALRERVPANEGRTL